MNNRYLIDTQILIWSIADVDKLSDSIKMILSNNTILISQISLLEIAIKKKIEKLTHVPISISDLINQLLQDGFKILAILNKHIADYTSIPLFENHKDPFDRLLLATAYSENIPIISADKNFSLYDGIIDIIKA